MFANCNSDEQAATAGEFLQLSALVGYLGLISADAQELGAARGTVDTSVATVAAPFYGHRSETLISGAPLSVRESAFASERRPSRAKELIAELHVINAQIHQIMAQVERAMSRLAITG